MSHSCFNASAFAAATCVFSTLHRLEFPANERVHIQVSLNVEAPAFQLYCAWGFTTTTVTSCQPHTPTFQRTCQSIRHETVMVNIKVFQQRFSPPFNFDKLFGACYKFSLTVKSLLNFFIFKFNLRRHLLAIRD